MHEKFIFVGERGNSLIDNMFKDLYSDTRVINMFNMIEDTPKIFKWIIYRHFGLRYNRIISLPFKNIWKRYFGLNEMKWDKDIAYYVIFTNATLIPMTPKYLNELKKKYNIKYVLYMIDSINSQAALFAREYIKKVKFDYIFWLDKCKTDSSNKLTSEYHYSIIDDPTSYKIVYDIYFGGWDGGRLKILNSIYKIAKHNNVKLFFRINNVKKNDIQSVNDIKYNTVLDYKEVVAETKKANCILEILRSVQNFPTLRYNEAVCYNKKLLTNNEDIVNLPFYDPRYMKVFETPEDIDWEWVKKRENIDYGYDGRFSPVKLIDKIIELEKEKEGC